MILPRRRILLPCWLALVAVGCAPTNTVPSLCDTVRAQVATGALPVDLASAWYSECAPYQVPPK